MKNTEIRPSRHVPRPRRSGVAFLTVVIALAVGGAALGHIFTKNMTHALGRKQQEVERKIAKLREDINELELKEREALSRKNLADRLTSQRSKLKEISPENIVYVNPGGEPQPEPPLQ